MESIERVALSSGIFLALELVTLALKRVSCLQGNVSFLLLPTIQGESAHCLLNPRHMAQLSLMLMAFFCASSGFQSNNGLLTKDASSHIIACYFFQLEVNHLS